GIGRGSLYNTFGSKHELYEAALRRYQEANGAALQAVLEAPGSSRERLQAALDMVIDRARRDRDHRGCMITNAAVELAGHDPAVRRMVQRTLRLQEEAFQSVIEQGQLAGEIDAGADAVALAEFFVTTLNGIQVMARVDPDLRRLRSLADTAMRTV
ncbi:MAG: TetR/AcrR family transcriptional regulator, partial [Propionibacteriales bacterium]|nr:TetR/AcrR family transcriptional regulator [Propionibacteriales bacterium]